MRSCVVAVIGHVDHGKTSLVRALTGIETDRLKEEKARGMSIALGFAHRDYPSGAIDFIDAPGHEDFVRTMVSGATGASAALLVVSAIEGVARQTIEHLEIATLLGITKGVIAITKADLLPRSEWSEQAAAIRVAISATGLAGEPIVFCSSGTGEGLDILNQELDDLLQRSSAQLRLPGFFLPVDRIFTVAGMGTIVTGTLLGAALEPGLEAVVLPAGKAVVVRGIQTHGVERDFVEAGSRTAVNLRSVSRDDVRPGDVLCTPGCFSTSAQIDVFLTVSPSGGRAVKHLDQVRVMLGTRSATAMVRLMDGNRIEPGESNYAQLRFSAPVIAFAGQRAVLRRLSPVETIGGALIIDPAASPMRRSDHDRMMVLGAALRGDLPAIADALGARSGGVVRIGEVARLSSQTSEYVCATLDPHYLDLGAGQMGRRSALEAAVQAYIDALASLHLGAPLRPGFSEARLRQMLTGSFPPVLLDHAERQLAQDRRIVRGHGRVALAEHDPLGELSVARRAQLDMLEQALREGSLTPSSLEETFADADTRRDLVGLLVASGRAVEVMNHALRQLLLFHVESLAQAEQDLHAAFPFPAQFRTGEAREALKTSRKFIVPILEYLDAQGVTVRNGDLRRLARPASPGSDVDEVI
jgi:selenocysteine-specific elongation factor